MRLPQPFPTLPIRACNGLHLLSLLAVGSSLAVQAQVGKVERVGREMRQRLSPDYPAVRCGAKRTMTTRLAPFQIAEPMEDPLRSVTRIYRRWTVHSLTVLQDYRDPPAPVALRRQW